MRKILLFIGVLLLLLACAKSNKNEDFIEITVSSWNRIPNDRNGEDYIRLWINDTLVFSDTFHVGYVDSIQDTWYDDMKVANIPNTGRDSVKLRVRFVSLDSVLFAGRHAVDTTFCYKIKNIPTMNIDYFRQLNCFRVWDRVNNPQFYQIE